MPHAFLDLAGAEPRLTFQAPVTLGSKREITPQGYLLIRDTVIARTGVQAYAGHEVPVEPGPMGYIEIERHADDVFRPETLASFEGVPITNDHPSVSVGPENYRDHLVGVLRNVRQGIGDQAHLMLGDALIYCRKAIADIESGKRQVSGGYDANYVRLEAGRGRQTDIVGNHLAIVERGRCGPVCAFGDQETPLMTTTAPAPGRRTVPAIRRRMSDRDLQVQRIMAAARANDEEMLASEVEAMMEAPEEAVVDPLDELRTGLATVMSAIEAINARLDQAAAAPTAAAEAAEAVAEVAEAAAAVAEAAGEDLPEEMTTDAAFRAVVARAEILAPGTRIPTGDAVATPKARGASIVAIERKAMTAVFDADPNLVKPLVGANPDFAAMPASALHVAFVAASELKKQRNNTSVVGGAVRFDDQSTAHKPPSASERQAAYDEFWGRKRA